MATITERRRIDALVENVFPIVADVRNFRKAVPHITNIEFITEQQVGPGTRFLETRIMHGREASTELEVRDYVENERVRMVADAGGTIWDTVFSVSTPNEESTATELTMVMDAKPHKFFAKLMIPLIMRMVRKGVAADMDSVKEYCEANAH